MIDEERLEDELEAFYREAPKSQPRQRRVTANVLAATRDETEQPDIRPDTMPAIEGATTITMRRIWTVLSPAKTITVGALILAIGGALFVTSPFGQSGDSAPGAAVDPEAAFVTGTIGWAPECKDAPPVMEDGVVVQMGGSCAPRTVESDDARLAGTSVVSWNRSIHRTTDGRTYSVRSQVEDIRGDGGGWVCRADAVPDRGLGGFYVYQLQGSDLYECRGDGDNAGLMALLVVTTGPGDPETIEGLIFPGELPPSAELPSAE